MSTPDWLQHAARRSQAEPGMMGYVFEQYRQMERLSEEQLAAELGCSRDTLHRVALCLRPEEARFAEQVTAIATRFELELLPLVQVVRRVDVMSSPAPMPNGDTAMWSAARDRVKDDGKAS